MKDLSTDIDYLKKNYRQIFLQTSEEFNEKIEKMEPDEFLKFLNVDALKEAYELQLDILERRKKIQCCGCASCCKLACSEFSYDELNLKAENGDKFATQFVSVFVPYEDEEDARKIYPEYFELLKDKAQDEKVYFYHCPKVTGDNRCPDYQNRPQVCRDFPDNPLGFLPKKCGYTFWKEEVEDIALKLRATLEIVDFYKGQLQKNNGL